jgi:hypothetical protein
MINCSQSCQELLVQPLCSKHLDLCSSAIILRLAEAAWTQSVPSRGSVGSVVLSNGVGGYGPDATA